MPIPKKSEPKKVLFRGHVVVKDWEQILAGEQKGVPGVLKGEIVHPEALAGKTLFFESPVHEKDGVAKTLIDRFFINKTKDLRTLVLERVTIFENEGSSAEKPVKAKNIDWATATNEGRYFYGIVTKEAPKRVTVLEDRLYGLEEGLSRYDAMIQAYEAKKEELRASEYVSEDGKKATGEAAPRPVFALAVLDEAGTLHGFFPPTSSRYPVHVSGKEPGRSNPDVVRELSGATVSVDEVRSLARELEAHAKEALGVANPRVVVALGQSIAESKSEEIRGGKFFESVMKRLTPCLPEASAGIATRPGFRGMVTVNTNGLFVKRILPEQKGQNGLIFYNYPLAAFSEVKDVSEKLNALNEAAKARRADQHKTAEETKEEVRTHEVDGRNSASSNDEDFEPEI